MITKPLKAILILACALLFFNPLSSKADIINFVKITNNGNPDVAGQLSVDVTSSGIGVSFKFFNVGATASSICDIYFDDGTLLGISSIVNGPTGVSFDDPANPGDLPGGNDIKFVTTAGFSADSDSPVEANGVNPGEWVEIIFNLQSNKGFNDVISSLNNGSLRIGLHVQAIGTPGGSDSYVNKVPEPTTLLFLGAGLVGLGVLARKRYKK